MTRKLAGASSDDERAEFNRQARELGLPDEAIAQLDRTEAEVVEVLEPNWLAVHVYMRCQQTVTALSTMQSARTVYHGISAVEAGAAMQAVSIPRARRGEVLAQVQHMGSIAAGMWNERSKRA